MSLANYAEDKVQDHLFGGAAFTQPTGHKLHLHTADPGEAGTANEVVGGSYVAQSIAFNASASGVVTNNGAVEFTGMPATTVTHWSVQDGSANPLAYGAFDASVVLGAGDTLRVADTALDITAD